MFKENAMSVSLREVLEGAEYDINTYNDAIWLLSKRSEFEDLLEEAEETVERIGEERERDFE